MPPTAPRRPLAALIPSLDAPTILVFTNGQKSGQNVGPTSRENIVKLLGV